MPQKNSILSKFWNELRRRRVVHVITVYASAAFVIIELVNNLTDPLNLPPKLSTILVIILAVGFPLAVILAWIYDLTPEGIEKTTPAEETEGTEKTKVPNAWRIATYVSFVVIAGLVTLNIVGGPKELRAGNIQSLVILPFDNFTGDDKLDYFVEGMHGSLIGDMGRISGLRVISKTSANTYKGKEMTAPEIAQELDVDAVVETQIMCLGDSICLQVRIISTFPEEKQLWVADYKEEKSKILNLYNRVTRQIANEVKIELTSDEERLLAESRTVDPDAYDAYLKGQFHWERLGDEDIDSALHYFQLAIEKNPDWAAPYAGLALTWQVLGGFAYAPHADAFAKASEYLNKALELDPNSANSHYLKALSAVWIEGDWENGEMEFLRALKLNPNDALCRIYYAHLLMLLQRTGEAVTQANLALALDPLRPLVLGLYGAVMNQTGDYQSAREQTEKALSIDPDNSFAVGRLAHSYLATGDTIKWYETVKRSYYWTDDEYLAYLDSVFQKHGYLGVIEDRIKVNEEVYRNGGTISFTGQASRYLIVKAYDKAMDYYEKAYEVKHGALAYISLDVNTYPELKDNPRYIALLKKMNLPLAVD
jgi:TolB-like protein